MGWDACVTGVHLERQCAHRRRALECEFGRRIVHIPARCCSFFFFQPRIAHPCHVGRIYGQLQYNPGRGGADLLQHLWELSHLVNW